GVAAPGTPGSARGSEAAGPSVGDHQGAAEGAVAAVVAGEVDRWAVGSCTTGPYRIGVAVARRHGDNLGGVLATTPAAKSGRTGSAAPSAAAPALHLHRRAAGGPPP